MPVWFYVVITLVALVYLFMLVIDIVNILDSGEFLGISVLSFIGLAGTLLVYKRKWYGILFALIPIACSVIISITSDYGIYKRDYLAIALFFAVPFMLLLLLSVIPVKERIIKEPVLNNANQKAIIPYMVNKKYVVMLLIVALAQIALFFLPWLILDNDVHLYKINDIPKMSKEALWRFSRELFILPNLLLYVAIVAMAITVILQFIEIFFVLAKRNINSKVVKIANLCVVTECVCIVFMFVAFWIILFFGFYPTPWLLIMPTALVCQLKFSKQMTIKQ